MIRIYLVCLGFLLAGSAAAAADDAGVIDEVLAILYERGIVDDARYGELVAKHHRYEQERSPGRARLEWSGDLRGRLENFWYEDSALDERRPDRTRIRYRLRLQGVARVNEWAEAVFRLASGETDNPRSRDRTLGAGVDFDGDPLSIDLAYLQLTAPGRWVGEGKRLELLFGKTRNPFRWKHGKDYLLWDGDFTPEGVALRYGSELSSGARFFLHAGSFVVDEAGTAKDPHVSGIQAGVETAVSDTVDFGARLSAYDWRSLDADFHGRASASGAIPDGTSRGAPGSSSRGIRVGEAAAYLRYAGMEGWPILVYGHYAVNFSAESSELFPAAGPEDTGWTLGLEIGDKRWMALLGLAYTRAEANFWPAQFTDSTLFDGTTNRAGWNLYGSRQLLPGTDLNVGLYLSEPLRRSLPDFASSVALADRVRLQTDLVVSF